MRSFLPIVLLLAACSRPVAVTTTPTAATESPAVGAVGNTVSSVNPNAGAGAAIRTAAPDTSARPAWLRQRIAAVLAEAKVPRPPIRVLRYAYRGQQVYWQSAPCCDQYSTVFDPKGNVVCHPDGGITGKGDGQCPDFEQRKTDERLVWQDPR